MLILGEYPIVVAKITKPLLQTISWIQKAYSSLTKSVITTDLNFYTCFPMEALDKATKLSAPIDFAVS